MQFFRTIRRYFIILGVFLDYAFKVLKQKIFGGQIAFISPKELRQTLEDLGGSFLKFGQLASVRPDYFPEEYCRELLGLLDEVPPIEPQLLDGIFLKEYGRRPEEVFKKFERIPLAAASFGQVHEAWLKEGERVAVKIQRPFVAEDFSYDARFFSFLGWIIQRSKIIKTVSPVRVVRDFIHWTERELDYIKEAENLARLLEQNLKNKLPVKIPKVYSEYTTRRILVMEFIEGETLKSYFLRHEPPPNPHKFFKEVIFFELYSFLFDGFFNADPHPANILVLPNGGFGLVDAGISAEVSISDRKRMAGYFKTVVKEEEFEEAVKAFLKMVRTPLLEMLGEAKRNYPQHWMRIQFIKNLFLRKLKEGLNDIMGRWHRASREIGELHDRSPMHKFMELFQLAERSGIRMPEAAVLFARTFLSIDVAILELTPDFNMPIAVNEFFEKYKEELKKLEELPDELPLYLRPDVNPEWSEILRSFDEELKALDKELLMEKVSGMMETFE